MKGWLYLIADFSYGEEKLEEALHAGVDFIQLREKELSSAKYLMCARKLKQMTQTYHTRLIINDRIDIALLSGADGVHLGQSDIPVKDARAVLGPHAVIGATAKTAEQAAIAEQEGADYIGSGAWFTTATKKDAVLLSEEVYGEILKAAQIPNVAVGGISVENCKKPMEAGASGLAISAGILQSENPAAEVKKIRSILSQYERRGVPV